MAHEHDRGNAAAIAIELYPTLTDGFTIPELPDFTLDKFNFDPDLTSDLYQDPKAVTVGDVTDACVDGDGDFDIMMKAVDAHLEREFKGNRITGAQYAEVYASVIQSTLNNATSFTLQKDQARWQAITAQMQARIAEIEATKALISLEQAKVETAKAIFDMQNSGAQYALTKMKIATEDATNCSIRADNAIKDYQLDYVLPADVALKTYERTELMPSQVAINQVQSDRILPAEAAVKEFENRVLQPIEQALQELQRDRILPLSADIEEYRLDNIMPVELAQQQHILNQRMPAETNVVKEQWEQARAQTLELRSDGLTPISGVIGRQKEGMDWDNDTKEYTLSDILTKQASLLSKQIDLTGEQREAERAKTLDTRSDGQTVEGSVGKQKDLYDQQIDSFIKDAQYKVSKMYLDGWITQKTLDEGLNAPTQLTNNEVNEVIAAVRANNSLGS